MCVRGPDFWLCPACAAGHSHRLQMPPLDDPESHPQRTHICGPLGFDAFTTLGGS